MTAEILVGDALAVLKTMPAESVHLCVCSPPYWGLRDYSTGTWEGGLSECDHKNGTLASSKTGLRNDGRKHEGLYEGEKLAVEGMPFREECGKCGARRIDRQLGLEPTPEEHVDRLVEVFREVRRVLRRDGVIAVNYGDCYACAPNGRSAADTKAAGGDDRTFRDKPFNTATRPRKREELTGGGCATRSTRDVGVRGASGAGLKPKDLVGMPFRLALALQADGWWWRSCMPYVKRNSMPESARDRPSTALEYVMLFSRAERYYWDADAVRRPQESKNPAHPSYRAKLLDGIGYTQTGDKWQGAETEGNGYYGPERKFLNPNGRNLRNSDFYFDSLDLCIAQAKAELAHLTHLRERGGLLLDEEGEPLALDVNTEASKEAHFAAFPRRLVTPLVQAGTSERGCCAECGAPWVRATKKSVGKSWGNHDTDDEQGNRQRGSGQDRVRINGSHYAAGYHPPITLGWRKSCRCSTDEVRPCVVLDIFAGTGTTLLVALELGRRAIGIELSGKYCAMARRRLKRAQLPLPLHSEESEASPVDSSPAWAQQRLELAAD